MHTEAAHREATRAWWEVRVDRRALVALGVGVALVELYLALTVAHYGDTLLADQYDDAYITYRYAANLAEGEGWRYNSYEAVNSASSFLYTLVLALAYRVGLTDLAAVSGVLGLASGAAAVALGYHAAWRVTHGNLLLAAAATLPFALAGALGLWATSGMETTFFAALVLAALSAHAFAWPRWARDALLVAVVLTRLEGVAVVAAVALAELVATRDLRRATRVAAPAAVAFALFLAWNRIAFGEWLPHPVAWKEQALYYAQPFHVRRQDVETFFEPWKPLLWSAVLAGAVALAVRWGAAPSREAAGGASPHDRALVFPAALALGLALLLASPRSDGERYAVHLLPVLGVSAALGWSGLLELCRARDGLLRTAAVFAVAWLALGAAWGSFDDLDRSRAQHVNIAAHQAARAELGAWLAENAPPGSVVLGSDLGMVGYQAKDLDFVDAIGLTTAGIPQDDWSAVIARVRALGPTYVADTGVGFRDDVVPQSLAVLAAPETTFAGVAPGQGLDLATVERTPLLTREGAGALFVLEEVRWRG